MSWVELSWVELSWVELSWVELSWEVGRDRGALSEISAQT